MEFVSKERVLARLGFQRELNALASPYAKANLPQSVLCKRLLQFEGEMFTFVEHPQVPSENNFAERTIRPRVIARKISGGTRSEAGSLTMAILSSLFATWKLRGEEAFAACLNMLKDSLKESLPQSAYIHSHNPELLRSSYNSFISKTNLFISIPRLQLGQAPKSVSHSPPH